MLTTRMTKNRKIALTIVIVLAMLFSLMTIAFNASALVDDNTPPTVTKIEATPSKELAEGDTVEIYVYATDESGIKSDNFLTGVGFAYLYPKVGEQLQQQTFTDCTEFCEEATNFLDYYTNNPDTNHQKQIQFPPAMEFCLDRYLAMRGDMRKGIRHCISLLADGVESFNYKRSVSTMATIASIEGMANIDFKLYGTADETNRPTARFIRYLKRYVAGRSEEKYKQYYSRRGEICHDGSIFLGDDDLYGDITEQDRDWILRLEIQQAARIALYNRLRRN